VRSASECRHRTSPSSSTQAAPTSGCPPPRATLRYVP
jgi:hypothetical protein